MTKPKLAEGSKWSRSNRDKTTVRDASGDLIYIEDECLTLNDRESVQYAHTYDALAVIRSAGLDPVWDAAVSLAEWWDALDGAAMLPVPLMRLLSANSAAVKGAMSDG